MPRPFAPPVTLTADDRTTLTNWARRPTTPQALAFRARIVLAAADAGTTNTAIAARLRTTTMTGGKWRNRFAARGVAGLHDEPRPGAQRTITDAQVDDVITTTLEETPVGATHWSTRRLAERLTMSQSAISRIWHAFGLEPHRWETFKLSKDPLFIGKVRDVVGLYLNPPDRALVLCVDEKPQIQATEGTTPILPMRPGQPEQHSHDYRMRTHPARHARSRRRARCQSRHRHWRSASPASERGVSQFPRHRRGEHAASARAAPDPR
jgi:transposase